MFLDDWNGHQNEPKKYGIQNDVYVRSVLVSDLRTLTRRGVASEVYKKIERAPVICQMPYLPENSAFSVTS